MERVSRPRPAQGTRTQGHATSAPPNVPRKPTTAFDFWFALQLKEMNIERLFSPDSLKKEKPGIAKMGFSFTAASFPILSFPFQLTNFCCFRLARIYINTFFWASSL